MPNINTLIRDHVSLSIRCVDRLYINGYVPTLQTSGQPCYFLSDHLGFPIPSSALFAPLRKRLADDVRDFAASGRIPVVKL